MPAGRPSSYDPKYIDELLAYFDVDPVRIKIIKIHQKDGTIKEIEEEVPNDTPLIEGFCRSIGICKATFHNWRKEHPEFLNAYNKIKTMQANVLIANGISGRYPSTFAQFAAKNMIGWRDKHEHLVGEDKDNPISKEWIINVRKPGDVKPEE